RRQPTHRTSGLPLVRRLRLCSAVGGRIEPRRGTTDERGAGTAWRSDGRQATDLRRSSSRTWLPPLGGRVRAPTEVGPAGLIQRAGRGEESAAGHHQPSAPRNEETYATDPDGRPRSRGVEGPGGR